MSDSHKLVKKDCGWHFGKTGGPCEKCKDGATSMAAQRRIAWQHSEVERVRKERKNKENR